MGHHQWGPRTAPAVLELVRRQVGRVAAAAAVVALLGQTSGLHHQWGPRMAPAVLELVRRQVGDVLQHYVPQGLVDAGCGM
jgi:hypothetical protein